MNFKDFIFPFLLVAFVFALCFGVCVGVRLSVLEDEAKILRKRVNDLELRIIRIEWKNQIRGEVANGK